ncbi:MAG TPA: YcaO-like family protein [Gaiellaceae bacterium]|jgi:ribosomal protein S12 methylthiotransferase accessory factor|nr:YcaO-like family protein [Gaiellaceae bacterium]
MIGALPPGLRRAVSAYTGIVTSVEECLASTGEPRLFQAACEVGQGNVLLGSSLSHLSGIGGAGRSRAEAASAAVGEAIERYSATYVPTEQLVVAPARELPGAVAPERFALFSDRQLVSTGFPFERFDRDTPVAWVEGYELPGRRPAFLPAELVYLGSAMPSGACSIGYATSSGLACGDTRVETLVRGLFELVERDAFMIVWAGRLSLPLVDLGARPDSPFEAAGLTFSAIDLSVFHQVPTVLGVVRAPAGFPGAVGVGAAAAPTVERAWWKALAEAYACRSAGAKLALLQTAQGSVETGRVATFEDHIVRYADHAHSPATAFLDASPTRVEAEAIAPLEGAGAEDWLTSLCRRIDRAGSTAYAVDVTSPDVAELGLTVSRVITPELCRLDVSHDARFLGGARLYEAASAIGLRPAALTEDGVNPDPHPFP